MRTCFSICLSTAARFSCATFHACTYLGVSSLFNYHYVQHAVSTLPLLTLAFNAPLAYFFAGEEPAMQCSNQAHFLTGFMRSKRAILFFLGCF